MFQVILADLAKLSPETKLAIACQVIVFLLAVWKAYRSSTKASFFEKAHEAVVTGIEVSNCQDCRDAAKAVAKDLGIEAKVKPIVAAIKATGARDL